MIRSNKPTSFGLLNTVKQKNEELLQNIRKDLQASRQKANDSIREILDNTTMNKLKREVGTIKSAVTEEMRRKDSALAAANVDAHNAVLELAKMQDKAALESKLNDTKVNAALMDVDDHRKQVEAELAEAQAELEANRLELENTYVERMAEIDATHTATQRETEEARAQIMEEGRRLEEYMDELSATEAKQAREAADTEHAIQALKQQAETHRTEMAARRKELANATAAIAERDQALVEADHALPLIEAALENAKVQLQDSEARRRQEVADLQQQIGEIMAEKNAELHDVRAVFEARLAEAAEQNAEKDRLLKDAVEVATAKDAENRRLKSQSQSESQSPSTATSPSKSTTTSPSKSQPQYASTKTAQTPSPKKSTKSKSNTSPPKSGGRRKMVRVPIRNGSATRLVPMEDESY